MKSPFSLLLLFWIDQEEEIIWWKMEDNNFKVRKCKFWQWRRSILKNNYDILWRKSFQLFYTSYWMNYTDFQFHFFTLSKFHDLFIVIIIKCFINDYALNNNNLVVIETKQTIPNIRLYNHCGKELECNSKVSDFLFYNYFSKIFFEKEIVNSILINTISGKFLS